MPLTHIGDSIGFNRTNIGFPTFATITVDFDLSDASFVLDDIGVAAAEGDLIVLSFNLGSGSANDVSLTGTGWTRQEDESTGGTRAIVYTKTVASGETATTWTATYSSPAGNAEQPRLHLFRGITEAGLKAHDASIVAAAPPVHLESWTALDGGQTSFTPTWGNAPESGEFLLYVIHTNGPAITAPSGVTVLYNGADGSAEVCIAYRIADGTSDDSNRTFTFASSCYREASTARFIDTAGLDVVSSVEEHASASDGSAPSVTTTAASGGHLIVIFTGYPSSVGTGLFDIPSGFTSAAQRSSVIGRTGAMATVAHKVIGADGSTGAVTTNDNDAGSGHRLGISLALRPTTTGYTATAPSVDGGAAVGDYLLSIFVGDGPDADSYGDQPGESGIDPAQDDWWDAISASDGRATTVVSRTLTAGGPTGDTTAERNDHVAGGEHFGAHLLFLGLLPIPRVKHLSRGDAPARVVKHGSRSSAPARVVTYQ